MKCLEQDCDVISFVVFVFTNKRLSARAGCLISGRSWPSVALETMTGVALWHSCSTVATAAAAVATTSVYGIN